MLKPIPWLWGLFGKVKGRRGVAVLVLDTSRDVDINLAINVIWGSRWG
jgi:hypothetical protein